MVFQVILAIVAAVAFADKPNGGTYGPPAPSVRSDSFENVAILRDDRIQEDDGKYNFDFEAENGIRFAEHGSPDGHENAIVSAGEYA